MYYVYTSKLSVKTYFIQHKWKNCQHFIRICKLSETFRIEDIVLAGFKMRYFVCFIYFKREKIKAASEESYSRSNNCS